MFPSTRTLVWLLWCVTSIAAHPLLHCNPKNAWLDWELEGLKASPKLWALVQFSCLSLSFVTSCSNSWCGLPLFLNAWGWIHGIWIDLPSAWTEFKVIGFLQNTFWGLKLTAISVGCFFVKEKREMWELNFYQLFSNSGKGLTGWFQWAEALTLPIIIILICMYN